MTQLLQNEFETSMETAEAWMKDIHEKLKENDNTQGPRDALERRLRETEKICSLEPNGKLLIDIVLSKAEVLLEESSEDEKHEILTKLKDVKAMFEETTTYMTHCHSRIEWVWLHWSEYMKALQEFNIWVQNIKKTLERDTELQLSLKEKQWQHEHFQVLLEDVNHQSHLLDRLLEEAASLYNRIGDPSVDEGVQKAMMYEYLQIKKKAQEKAAMIENIMKEHKAYDEDVSVFRAWLNSMIEKLKLSVRSTTDTPEHRLVVLQQIMKDVQNGEHKLEALEVKSTQVIKNTSPMGAEQICVELEDLRSALVKLKGMNSEEEESLFKTHNSENAFLDLAKQLEANIKEFRKAIKRLEGSLESGERVTNEEELIALWRTLNATKSALAAEETKAERVKVQMKDLFKFSKDVQPLSDSVIAAMREYQRAKTKAFKLSTETESALRQHFQNPLLEFQHWKPLTRQILDSTSAPMSDITMNNDVLLQIEMLLKESCSIKDKLEKLHIKTDQICSVFGAVRAESLLLEAAAAEKERAALHDHLLHRKSSLQTMASQSRDFDASCERLHKKVSDLRIKAVTESELQTDLVGKQTQLQRLQMLLEDLAKLEPYIEELNSIAQSNPVQKQKASQLSSEYLTLHRSLAAKSEECLTGLKIQTGIIKEMERNSNTSQSDKSPAGVRTNTGKEQIESNIRTSRYEKRTSGVETATGKITKGKKLAKTAGSLKINISKKISQKVPNAKPSINPARRNQEAGTVSHSVDVVDSTSEHSVKNVQTHSDVQQQLKEFEFWLNRENVKLSKICSSDSSGTEETKSRRSRLQKLQARVPEGQKLFEALLFHRPFMRIIENLRLRDLRYQWMLYKTKLKDCGNSSLDLNMSEKPRGVTKKSSGGLCSFLHRVFWAALPLQLLFLLLLLLAFLLPLFQETQNCTLSNNFARSFNLMLKYERPPPT